MIIYVDSKIDREDEEIPVQSTVKHDGDEMDLRCTIDQRYGGKICLTSQEEITVIAKAWELLPEELAARAEAAAEAMRDAVD